MLECQVRYPGSPRWQISSPGASETQAAVEPAPAQGEPLEERHTPASTFAPLVKLLEASRNRAGSIVVGQDDQLAGLLASYRRQFQEQILHDFDYNIQQLGRWADQQQPSGRAGDDAQVQDGFERLEAVRRLFVENDQWASRTEASCWLAFQQFYCDALALAAAMWGGTKTG